MIKFYDSYFIWIFYFILDDEIVEDRLVEYIYNDESYEYLNFSS